ncbi:MAG TPA: VanZ family protein [Steroidobacteraceae bacterium]|nr:VanZ family protein [Steroidobacteraceae bacterium]
MTESATDSTPPRRHGGTPYQRAARWLLGAVVALILYGSLFPFEFDAPSGLPLIALVASLRFERASRGDIVANLLLYIPLGLCLAAALPRRWSAVARFALTVTAGVLLSLAVELLQTMEPARVSSLTDVGLNAAGTAIGALGALIYIAVGTHVRIPGLVESRPAPVPLGFILLWLSYRLAPFVPTLDWQKIKDSLKPVFLDPAFDGFDALRFLVGWLVVAHAVRRIWRREYALLVLILLAAGTQFGRVLIVGKTLNPSELVALVSMFALLPLINRQPTARRLLVLSVALAAIVLAQGLEPWQLAPVARSFSWVPFMNSLSDSLEVNISVLIEKCFWYASLVWLLSQRTGALAASAVGVAIFVGAIECVQLWLPGRSAEITDPLLVLAAGGLLSLLSGKGDRTN